MLEVLGIVLLVVVILFTGRNGGLLGRSIDKHEKEKNIKSFKLYRKPN